MRKLRMNQQNAHSFGEKLGNVSMQEQEDMVVIDQLPDCEKRKKVVIEEIGDMVVVDTLDQTPVKKSFHGTNADGTRPRKTKLSMDDSHTSSSDLNANSRSRESTGTESYTTSENEYYTAYDVTVDDDIGSLLYHTAFVEDLIEEATEDTNQVEKDAKQDRGSEKTNTKFPVSHERSDVALSIASPVAASSQRDESSFENITYGSYTQQSTFEYPASATKVQVLKPFTYYKDYVSPTSVGVIDRQPTSLNRKLFGELDLSDSDVVAASADTHSSDEVMINFPPIAGISRSSPLFMTKAALSSTPSSSPRLSRKSFDESVSSADQVPPPFQMAQITPLQPTRHLRRRSSSASSRLSMKRQTVTVQSQRSSSKSANDNITSLQSVDLLNDRVNQRHSAISTEKALARDISAIISNLNECHTSTSTVPTPLTSSTAEQTPAPTTQSTVAVIKVHSQQVHVRHTSLGSFSEVEQGSPISIRGDHAHKKRELVLSPDTLPENASAEPDIEVGLDFSIAKRRGSYKKIVRTADRYRLPIAVTSIFLLFAIAALVVMAVVLPLS